MSTTIKPNFHIKEAAQYLGCSIDFLRDEMARKHISYYKRGRHYVFATKDLDEYLQRQRQPALGESKAQRKAVSA